MTDIRIIEKLNDLNQIMSMINRNLEEINKKLEKKEEKTEWHTPCRDCD